MFYCELARKRNKINPGRTNSCVRLDRTDFTTRNVQLVQEERLLLIVDFLFPHLFEYTHFSHFVAYQRKFGPGRLNAEVSRSQTDTHKTGIIALNDLSAFRRGRYLHNAQ